MATETQFYAAVKAACDAAGITSGVDFVEMTCTDNADGYGEEYWEGALQTLKWFVACGDLEAAARNEM